MEYAGQKPGGHGLKMQIAGNSVGSGAEPFIIAEMSGNHNQSFERALEIVDAAARAGAHAIKLQTYTADTMTLDLKEREFFISDEKSPWKGQSLYDLYKIAHTPWEWHKPIFERAKNKGLICFSTPFDETAVDFLEKLGVPIYKIASFENTDIHLIQRVAETGKPLIISTGMATISEIHEAVTAARNEGCQNIVLLKCTSSYPAPFKDMNIKSIQSLRETFNVESGLSDHSMGSTVAITSIAFGATVIEKHFTLKRADGGVDSAFSMEPHEFKQMVEDLKNAREAIGNVRYGLTASEEKSRIFRRSTYVVKDMDEGEVFNESNVRLIRPGLGLEPKYLEMILGRKANKTIKKGTPLAWDLIS